LRCDAQGVAARDQDEAGGRGIGGKSAERTFSESNATGGKRSMDLAGGKLNLPYRCLRAERSGALLGAKAGGAQRDGNEQPAMHAIACYQMVLLQSEPRP
jgi:hypothetical protein